MKRYCLYAIGAAVLAGTFMLGQATAQEQPAPAWRQAGPEHEALKKLKGDWDLDLTFWMVPGQPPMKGTATATYEMILGGKFVQETVESNFGGHPFEGLGLLGYDTVRKRYVSLWMDNGSPIMNVYQGPAKDGVITMTGEDVNPMTASLRKVQHTLKWQGADQFTAEAWDLGPDGKPATKTMMIVYKRKAAGCGCDDGCGCGCEDGCGCDDGCGG